MYMCVHVHVYLLGWVHRALQSTRRRATRVKQNRQGVCATHSSRVAEMSEAGSWWNRREEESGSEGSLPHLDLSYTRDPMLALYSRVVSIRFPCMSG